MRDLEAHGVVLGETYPEPIVHHGTARARAIAAYQQARVALTGSKLRERSG